MRVFLFVIVFVVKVVCVCERGEKKFYFPSVLYVQTRECEVGEIRW